MSFVVGVLLGLPIAALEVAMRHLRVHVGPFALNDTSLAAPFVLVPLALFWGWTWASDRWAKRAVPRLILYTVGLYLALSLVGPLDMLIFWPTIDVQLLASHAEDLASATLIFALPAILAAILFWSYGSGRVPMNKFTLAVGYLAGPAVATISPLVAIGTVAGTAAGHAWRVPSSRGTIALLVIALMLAITFGLPFALAIAGLGPSPVRALLP